MTRPIQLLLLVLTVATVGFQLRTVVRNGTAGVSPSTWLAMTASTTVWLGYGVLVEEHTVTGINVIVLAATLALAGVLVRTGAVTVAQGAPYLLGPLGLVALAWSTQQPWLLGATGTLVTVGRLVPQLLVTLRATDHSGVSVASWLGNGTSNLVWAGYGVHVGDVFVLWPCLLAGLLSFAIVAATRAPTRDARDPRHGGGGHDVGAVRVS